MKYLLVVISFLFYLLSSSCLANADNKIATENLNYAIEQVFPRAFKKIKKNSYEFCPDNTCIQFVGNKNVKTFELAIIFLYYEGDYFDLDRWRKMDGVKENLITILKSNKIDPCVKGGNIDHGCLKNEFKNAKMKVNNIRYDEDKKSIIPLWQ